MFIVSTLFDFTAVSFFFFFKNPPPPEPPPLPLRAPLPTPRPPPRRGVAQPGGEPIRGLRRREHADHARPSYHVRAGKPPQIIDGLGGHAAVVGQVIVEPGTAPPLGERRCKSRDPLARERQLHLTVLLRDREVLVAHPFQHVERLELVQQPNQSVPGTLG